jgi:hypothetical protein
VSSTAAAAREADASPHLLDLADGLPAEAQVVLAMLAELDRVALAEVERALLERLRQPVSAADRRATELGLLASLLNSQPLDANGRTPVIPAKDYDALRISTGSEAPTAETLAAKFGSWRKACRHAYGMRQDGSYSSSPSRPWSNAMLGKPKRLYVRDDVVAAVRGCGLALGRVPSVNDYLRWARRQRAKARQSGLQVTAPSQAVVYRFFAHWQDAVSDARFDMVEIARARLQKLLGAAGVPALPNDPLQRLQTAAAEHLAAAGFDQLHVDRFEKEGFAWLPLDRACALAHLLGGSLDWLGGRALDPGEPSAASGRFDSTRYKAALKEAPITATAMRDLLGLGVAAYNGIVGGREAMVLAELVLIAKQLKLAASELVVA